MTYPSNDTNGAQGPDGSKDARIMTIKARQNSNQSVFLKILAETSSVREAVRHANISSATAYRWRRQDPEFRQLWTKALAEGYEQLELEMLARMRHGTEKHHFHGGQIVHTEIVHNDAAAMRLLAYHRESVAAERAAQPAENIHTGILREKLNNKLDDMRARFLARYPKADYGPDANDSDEEVPNE